MIVFPPLTGDRSDDALLFGTAWNVGAGGTASYSFPGANSLWDPLAYGALSEPALGYAPLEDAARAAVRQILAAWSAVAGLGLVEVADDASGAGMLRFAFTTYGMDGGQLAYAYAPTDSASGGDVWLNGRQIGLFADPVPGTLGHFILLHEAGHALGLKHPYEASPLNPVTLDAPQDSLFETVMSYSVWSGILLAGNNGIANIDRLPSTPMALDIDALQALYGRNLSHNAGDDVYLYDAAGKYLETIFDGGGCDTILASGERDAVIDLRPDHWSQLGLPVWIDGGTLQIAETVRIHSDTLIENALGGEGHDRLIGNAADNHLDGGAGIDTAVFSGARANYTLAQTAGGYTVGDTTGADGTDTLANIERLQFADRKLALDLTPAGNAGQALEFIGMLDYSQIGNSAVHGLILYFFDLGYGMSALCQTAIDVGLVRTLAGSDSNLDLAKLVYRNVVGTEADAATASWLAGFMQGSGGAFSQAGFLAAVAGLEINQAHINLVGLQQTGIEYVSL